MIDAYFPPVPEATDSPSPPSDDSSPKDEPYPTYQLPPSTHTFEWPSNEGQQDQLKIDNMSWDMFFDMPPDLVQAGDD